MLMLAAPAAAGGPVPDGIAGVYRTEKLSDRNAWPLPIPGDGQNNRCDPGNVVAVKWSPDGRYLAAEVDTGRAISLCLYGLAAFSFGIGAPKKVTVHRVSSSGNAPMVQKAPPTGTAGTGAAPPANVFQRLKELRSSPTSPSEFEFAWAPSLNSATPFAFTRSGPNESPRVFGWVAPTSDTPGKSQTGRLEGRLDEGRYAALDGLSPARVAGHAFYTPSWVLPMKGDGRPRLSVVSTFGLGCGKSHILLLPEQSGLQELPRDVSPPCSSSDRTAQGAVAREPVWSTTSGRERLAYFRDATNGRQSLCLVERGPSTSVREDCNLLPQEESFVDRYHPAWSPDGRFLSFYGSVPSDSRQKVRRPSACIGSCLQVIDLNDTHRPLHTRASRIYPNPLQAAPMLVDSRGRTWALVIKNSMEGQPDRLTAVALDGSGERDIPTGLQNLVAVDVVRHASGLRLAVSAMGYAGLNGARLETKKLFILPLSTDGW